MSAHKARKPGFPTLSTGNPFQIQTEKYKNLHQDEIDASMPRRKIHKIGGNWKYFVTRSAMLLEEMGATNSCREHTHFRDELKSFPRGEPILEVFGHNALAVAGLRAKETH